MNDYSTCLISNILCSVKTFVDDDALCYSMKFQKLIVNEGKIEVEHWGYEVNATIPSINASDNKIDQPQCIGYNGGYAVLNFITVDESNSKFAIINTWTGSVLNFSVDEGYFCKNVAEPLECLIEPICSLSLTDNVRSIIRFPQTALSPLKWSRMFVFSHDFKSETTTLVRIIRDRCWQGVAFHPLGHQLCLSLVNTYSYKCKIMKMDAYSFDIIGARDFRSRFWTDTVEEGTVIQSILQYSHDGESIIVVSTLSCRKGAICVLQFDSTLLACLRCWRSIDRTTLPILVSDKIGFTVSFCGSCIKLWGWDGKSGSIICVIALGKPSSLSSICRAVIRDNINFKNIPELPLPVPLLHYLAFSSQL